MTEMFGKLEAKPDDRIKPLAKYTAGAAPAGATAPAAQAAVDWFSQVPAWGMFENDTLGDCVPATILHIIEQQTRYAGKPVVPVDADATALYRQDAASPWTPGSGAGPGCYCSTALINWLFNGVTIGGQPAPDKLTAALGLDLKNMTDFVNAVTWFSNVMMGVQLPASAEAQTGAGLVWDVPTGGPTGQGLPGSWGSHCVPLVGIDAGGNFVCVTWGALQRMTPAFILAYCDEAYTVVSQDFIEANGSAPTGLSLAQIIVEAYGMEWDGLVTMEAISCAYKLLLGRDPNDPATLDPSASGWLHSTNGGMILGILQSAEYAADNPTMTAAMLPTLYGLLLSRSPDPSASGWVGLPTAQVVAGIIGSPEFHALRG